MLYIAHRGNIDGKHPNDENRPEYLQKALDKGYNVETDVWYIGNEYYLGHDKPMYKINIKFLENINVWCHAKNYEALLILNKNKQINCFWHQNEDWTITSKGFIWEYPDQSLKCNSPRNNTICVMPENNSVDIQHIVRMGYGGVCTDYCHKMRSEMTGIANTYQYNEEDVNPYFSALYEICKSMFSI